MALIIIVIGKKMTTRSIPEDNGHEGVINWRQVLKIGKSELAGESSIESQRNQDILRILSD